MPEIQSDNLATTNVVQGSENEATQVNDKVAQIDSFLTEIMTVDLLYGDIALSALEFKRYRKYKIFNAISQYPLSSLIIQAVPREFVVDSTDVSNAEDILVVLGMTELLHLAGTKVRYETDGTADGLEIAA